MHLVQNIYKPQKYLTAKMQNYLNTYRGTEASVLSLDMTVVELTVADGSGCQTVQINKLG